MVTWTYMFGLKMRAEGLLRACVQLLIIQVMCIELVLPCTSVIYALYKCINRCNDIMYFR
jgi:hypothetical protein